MPGSWSHLAARFFDVVTAARLDEREEALLNTWLRPVERALFLAQSPADQRHGWECGAEVAAVVPDRPDLIRAALLHDVGKRHASLGPVGRVIASVVIRLSRWRPGRIGLYAAHGSVAATELGELGAEPVVVAFARHHHEERPESIPAWEWSLLVAADRARIGAGGQTDGYAVASTPDGEP